MPVRFVCLANSYKEGGRCLAGIVLDHLDNPIIENGLPKWIRPVSGSAHGEINKDLVSHIRLLDIIEIEIIKYVRDGYQSENAVFLANSIYAVGIFDRAKLFSLVESRPNLFGTTKKAIHVDYIGSLHHSLTLVQVTDFKVYEQSYSDNPGIKKIRISFWYKADEYDFPVTDPVFLHHYQTNISYMDNVKEMYLTLSVGVPLNEFHFKLVAGVIRI